MSSSHGCPQRVLGHNEPARPQPGAPGRRATPPCSLPRSSSLAPWSPALLALALLPLAAGCAAGGAHAPPSGGPVDLGGAPDPDLSVPAKFRDFPENPVIDHSGGEPVNSSSLFGGKPVLTEAPCVVEPEPGAYIPRNWIPPRFRFTRPAGQDLFEITISAPDEEFPLVVYTASDRWPMLDDYWSKLAQRAQVAPLTVTVTVRGIRQADAGPQTPPTVHVGQSSTFTIAPSSVSGSIFYWSVGGGQPSLRAAVVGKKDTRVVMRANPTSGACTGCHVPTPDGQFVAFTQTSDIPTGSNASIGFRSVDAKGGDPSWLSSAARQLLTRPGQQMPVFSPAYFGDRQRLMVSVLNTGNRSDLIWTDLMTQSADRAIGWDVIRRGGNDRTSATQPFWSRDGTELVYVSASSVKNGVEVTDGDLLYVPWASGRGGDAQPVQGASDYDFNEYAPALSADNKMLAYARVPSGTSSFGSTSAEILVVQQPLGTNPKRLEANDPPECLHGSPGFFAPGNSWPRFAPSSTDVGNQRYYWLVFSSKRGDGVTAQVYIAAVILDLTTEPGLISSSRALYLWNQPPTDSNHTPVWDAVVVPPQ